MNRITIAIIPSLVLALTVVFVQAGEANTPSADGDSELVLLLDWRDGSAPGGVIRLTIENRSRGPIRVIDPPDILADGCWWSLGAYDICIAGPDGKQQSYQCRYPPEPKPPPEPEPPKTVVLLPGRSVGVLVDLRRDSAKPWAFENGKYTIAASYEPGRTHFPDLAKELPLVGKKISSKAVTCQEEGGIPGRAEDAPPFSGSSEIDQG
jgi:hypothetical protein